MRPAGDHQGPQRGAGAETVQAGVQGAPGVCLRGRAGLAGGGVNEHPVYWTATLACTHETATQGRPSEGNWVSCDTCHTQEQILSVAPILTAVTGWVQETLPFAASLEAA